MSRAIPGFAAKYDIADLVKCIAPRPFLIVSGTEDKYSMDADEIYKEALEAYTTLNAGERLEQARYEGGHSLDEERSGRIIEWVVASLSL